METQIDGRMLTVTGIDSGEKFRLLDKAIKEADLMHSGIEIKPKTGEVNISCHPGSEERLQKVAALLQEEN